MHTSFEVIPPPYPANLQQLLATSALIVCLERIASSGILPEEQEADIRILICRACRVFEIPTIAERPTAEVREFMR